MSSCFYIFTPVSTSFLKSDVFKNLSGNATKVLLILQSFSDFNGKSVYPKQKKIMELTGLSEYQVRTALRELEENSLIEIRRKQTGNTYYFTELLYKKNGNNSYKGHIENTNIDFEHNNSNKTQSKIIEKKVSNIKKIEPYKPQENEVSKPEKTSSPTFNKLEFLNKDLKKNKLNKTTTYNSSKNNVVLEKKSDNPVVVFSDEILKKLVTYGIGMSLANKLVKTYPNAPYKEIFYDTESRRGSIQNIGGWVRKAIEEGWDYSALKKEIEKKEQMKVIAEKKKAEEKLEEQIRTDYERYKNKAIEEMKKHTDFEHKKQKILSEILKEPFIRDRYEKNPESPFVLGVLYDKIFKHYGVLSFEEFKNSENLIINYQ